MYDQTVRDCSHVVSQYINWDNMILELVLSMSLPNQQDRRSEPYHALPLL